jgi:hypothetical protein
LDANFAFDPVARLITYELDRALSPEETREFLESIVTHPVFGPGFNILGDYRRVWIETDMLCLRAFAREVRNRAEELGKCKWAMVFSVAAGFAATRLCAVLTHGSGVEFAPFLTVEEAEAWLGTVPVSARV